MQIAAPLSIVASMIIVAIYSLMVAGMEREHLS
jgi:hypothetical protein